MPIRLTMAYAQRLATERFDVGSQPRKDIVSLCDFGERVREAEASGFELQRSQYLRLTQEARSAGDRLLLDDVLTGCASLRLHERFELSFFAAAMLSAVHAMDEAVRTSLSEAAISKDKDKEHEKDKTVAEKALGEQLDNLANAELVFLIGAGPNDFLRPFFMAVAAVLLAIFEVRAVELANRFEFPRKFVEAAIGHFDVWLSSDRPAAKWIAAYLNFEHQKAWAARVSDDVKSIQQALADWLQPTSEAAKKRVKAWARYRKSLLELPDLKETMLAENFGVRKVFVQPVARYKVAGMGTEAGTQLPDVANLIAGLISERIPGDELILLCGGPGSGKSTLCRVIASELASNEEMHPVFLRLRRLQHGQDIPTFVEAHLQKEGIIDKFADLADVSNLVLILDGFDELVMASRSRLREFFNTLKGDLTSGPLRDAKAIVSGRDTLFPNGAGLPTGSHVISLLPFDAPRIALWGEKWRSLHSGAREEDFQPEVFYDERVERGELKAPPLHHLVSWPLTLHLVARVHKSGALDFTKAAGPTVEKAILYKSIVAETALRQQEQSVGQGRLLPQQMREFVQAISWEMYSTSRDALDYNEGLPLLKSIYPGASETELAEFADVAIVNQPELTKGEEGGFEFVHKSFSEYFVAERFAHVIEKISHKTKDYDSEDLSYRMSVREAMSALSSLMGIRVLTSEVQEMLEPMLDDFKRFLQPVNDGKLRTTDLIEKLEVKRSRIEELIPAYASGNYQADVVEPVRGSRIVKNEREIHANFSVGLLILGCALCKRLSLRRRPKDRKRDAVTVEDGRLWKLISIMQAGDIQIDSGLAARCLSPVRIGMEGDPTSVSYAPIPPRMLQGVEGARFLLQDAATGVVDFATVLVLESILMRFLRSPLGRFGPDKSEYRHSFGPGDYFHGGVRYLIEIVSMLDRVGVLAAREEEKGAETIERVYALDWIEEMMRRGVTARGDLRVGIRELKEFRYFWEKFRYTLRRTPQSYMLRELTDRMEYVWKRILVDELELPAQTKETDRR